MFWMSLAWCGVFSAYLSVCLGCFGAFRCVSGVFCGDLGGLDVLRVF